MAMFGIVGMKHRPPLVQQHFNALPSGAPLLLKRDRENRFDRNAVQVWSGDHHVGYVKSEQVTPLAMAFDRALPEGTEVPAILRKEEGKWPLVEVPDAS
jgi:hypothetical protein